MVWHYKVANTELVSFKIWWLLHKPIVINYSEIYKSFDDEFEAL